jgi:hypothetical protein
MNMEVFLRRKEPHYHSARTREFGRVLLGHEPEYQTPSCGEFIAKRNERQSGAKGLSTRVR